MGIMKSFVESFILPGALLPLMAVSCENTGYQERPEFPGSGLDSSAFVRMNIDLEYVKHVKSLVQEADGSYTIVLPDGDPYIKFLPFEADLPAENTVFALEYKAENPIDKTEFFFIDAEGATDAARAQSGPGAEAADEWTHFSVRMKSSIKEFDWGNVRGPLIRPNQISISPRHCPSQITLSKTST